MLVTSSKTKKSTQARPPVLLNKNGNGPLKKVVFSFFSGAGFLDLGFESSGFKVGFVNEIYKPFMDAYQYARKGMGIGHKGCEYYLGNMEELVDGPGKKKLKSLVGDYRDDKALIGFIGGPPCPDFSAAGQNLGKNGRHGRLSEIYVKLIIQQKPDFFLFENVKGLWRTKSHREFYEELKKKLQASGYATTEKLINSIEYGTPQDRDRIIMVGFSKKLLPKKLINPNNRNELAEGVFPWTLNLKHDRENVLKNGKTKTGAVPETLTVGYWFKKNDVKHHANAVHYFQPRQALSKFQTIKEGNISGKSFKRLHRKSYSPTAAYGNNEVHLHPVQARRISVAEALAIQSLPRKFTFPGTMTLSDMFKAVGNGVPYLAARSIGTMISKFLDVCSPPEL